MKDGVDGDQLLTVAEAARILRLSREQTYAQIRTGALPSVRLGPRGIRVPRRAIDRLIDKALAK